MPGALWGQPPTGVPPGDRVSSALGAGWAPCGLTVAKDVHCTTARPPPVWGAGPQDLLGMGLGPRIPSRARDTPVQRPPAPPPARVLGGRCGGRRGTRGREEGGGPSRLQFALRFVATARSVETAAGRAPAARPRGCFTSESSLCLSPSFRPAPGSPIPARGPRPPPPPASGDLDAR